MKKILLITTGGTIASLETSEGLAPKITSEQILQYVPEVAQLCEIDAIQLLNLDSTNVTPKHWLIIKECIKENYANYDGFIVTHGTDTMSYTVAAMSYLVQNSGKPIVFTGSQKSISLRDSDGRSNLIDAFVYAVSDKAQGVRLVFDGKVIVGTRARKSRTKSYNAFSSIDYPYIAVLRDHKIVYDIEEKTTGDVVFYDELNDKVFVLRLTPGQDVDIINYLLDRYDALIIESFGVGGLPCYGNQEFIGAIEKWLANGKCLVMATQVQHEGSDMTVYKVGQRIKNEYEILEAYNMTVEAVFAKLMWILAITDDKDKIYEMFYKEVDKDIL